MRGSAHLAPRRLRVFILDPAPLMRVALRRVFEESADFTWGGESADPERAIHEVARSHPDLAIVDIAFSDISGLKLIENIRAASPHTRVIVFTGMAGIIYGDRCLRAGASGFVSKRQSTAVLFKAIRRALEGGVWLDEELTSQLMNRQHEAIKDPIASLSAMEFEVFRMIAEGHTSVTIAKALERSVRTIETYRHRIKSKLELANATELAQFAMRCLMEWPAGSTPKHPHAERRGKPTSVAPRAPAGASGQSATPAAEGIRGRALIVEDNIPTSSALAVTCRRLGYRTDIARTSDEAHAKLKIPPDVILLDLKLAGGDDGAEVLRTVRQEKLPTRVAVVTGLDDVSALEHVESFAPDAMFRKPVRFAELEQWLSAPRSEHAAK